MGRTRPNPSKRLAPVRGEGGGVSSEILRERCKRSFYQRVKVLEDIADGAMQYLVCGPKGTTSYEPTARDRLAALEMLARYGGIAAAEGPSENSLAWRTNETLATAILAALSDPSVKRWLVSTRPELMGILAAGAASAVTVPKIEAIEEADYLVEPAA